MRGRTSSWVLRGVDRQEASCGQLSSLGQAQRSPESTLDNSVGEELQGTYGSSAVQLSFLISTPEEKKSKGGAKWHIWSGGAVLVPSDSCLGKAAWVLRTQPPGTKCYSCPGRVAVSNEIRIGPSDLL